MNDKVLNNFLENTPDNIEAKKLQEQKDIYELFEQMTRRERRDMLKDKPKFSDIVNKYSRIHNLKSIAKKKNVQI